MKLNQSPNLFDKIFMQEALKQAKAALEKDEVPVGAVIVKDNKAIAKAHNQVETLKDPTAHAEMIAITQATNFLSSKWLTDCTLYVTLEPCSMCSGALVLARIKRICFAAVDPKTGGCGSVVNIVQHKMLNHRIDVDSGVLAEESSEMLKVFFKEKRVIGKKKI
jgi:tRNA(adenine34) deaminase